METDPLIAPTIQQLRTYATALGGNVAGSADFQKGLQNYNANMPLPAAYVVPIDQEMEGPNQNMTGLWQILDKNIGVIVELDARADRRGQDPAQQCETIEASLISSLINWSPVQCRVPNNQGFYFNRGGFLDLDRARMFYQWVFTLRYQITDADGWQPDTGEDLTGIELDIYHAPPFAPLPPTDGTPPAAIVVIPLPALGTQWDMNVTLWDAGATYWDGRNPTVGSEWDRTLWDNDTTDWDYPVP